MINVQIFGFKDDQDTRKALRFFSERRIAVHFVDLAERPAAPGELRRVNLLVQDPDRYAATGGWGYASYDGEGRPIPIDPKTDCMTCHASGPITSYLRPPRPGRR